MSWYEDHAGCLELRKAHLHPNLLHGSHILHSVRQSQKFYALVKRTSCIDSACEDDTQSETEMDLGQY